MADTQHAKKVAKRREHGRQQAMGVSVTHGGVGAAAPRPPQELGTSNASRAGLDASSSEDLNKSNAEDEVTRIREQMKANLAQRREALKKFNRPASELTGGSLPRADASSLRSNASSAASSLHRADSGASNRSTFLVSGGVYGRQDSRMSSVADTSAASGLSTLMHSPSMDEKRQVRGLAASVTSSAASFNNRTHRKAMESLEEKRVKNLSAPLPKATNAMERTTLYNYKSAAIAKKTMLVQNSILEENMADLRAKAERSAYRRPKSREELRWRKAVFVNCAVDLVAVLYMSYLGWVLHAEDTDMDPVAWQLSFGVAVILTLFKDAQMLMGLTQWLSPWLMFAVPTVVGHCYGAFLYFFMVYRSDWPCFLGQTNYNAARKHRMCYEGRLLAAFTSCSLFLTLSAFILWRFVIFTKAILRAHGELIEDLSVKELLQTVEDNLQDQVAAESAHAELDVAAEKDAAMAAHAAKTGKIAGAPKRSKKSAGTSMSSGARSNASEAAEAEAGDQAPAAMGPSGKGVLRSQKSIKRRALLPSMRRAQTVYPGATQTSVQHVVTLQEKAADTASSSQDVSRHDRASDSNV
mmetsp:Transcript_460/g.942  ORF Transcript_460/g.942 Transcript_460/m.942 type:complete len:582 (-) Transcript_460:257-2002(-)|eukprot:CAMPEP_0114261674 /NCGR_PEP_ID=MMETSP0058-20121206/21289_1 /TAXON_ID=36894 /ORGANISM="Pyramimonas parkeae, CCMP726" /LENGTH=581 /DNA_ID=CAMNT_0001377277 /DNA_START=166 /DNA_END=1911 /DNA_ORIENTATION=+